MIAACHGLEDFRMVHNFLKITLSWPQEYKKGGPRPKTQAPATSEDGILLSAEQLAVAARLSDDFDRQLIWQAQLLKSRFLKEDLLKYSGEIRLLLGIPFTPAA
jgi:hypothetical protein